MFPIGLVDVGILWRIDNLNVMLQPMMSRIFGMTRSWYVGASREMHRNLSFVAVSGTDTSVTLSNSVIWNRIYPRSDSNFLLIASAWYAL